MYPPPVVAFEGIVLDRSKTRGFMIFRIIQSPDLLLVHEKVISMLTENCPEKGRD